MAPGFKTWHEIWAWTTQSHKETRGILACTCLGRARSTLKPRCIITDDLHTFSCLEDGGNITKWSRGELKKRLNTTHPHTSPPSNPLYDATSPLNVYVPMEVFLEFGRLIRITQVQSDNMMVRANQMPTIQGAFWSPWKNRILLHKRLRTEPKKHQISGQTIPVSSAAVWLIPILLPHWAYNQNKIDICTMWKLWRSIDGCLMPVLSSPIRDLRGRQGGSLYYKGNQC